MFKKLLLTTILCLLPSAALAQARATTTNVGTITIRKILSGSLTFNTGTSLLLPTGCATPAVSFVGDTDTGFGRSGADLACIAGGGAAITIGRAGSITEIRAASNDQIFLKTSSAASLNFGVNDGANWYLEGASGDFLPGATNTYSIGSTGSRVKAFNGVTLNISGTTTIATGLTGILRADSGVISVDTASSNEVVGVASGYKIARGITALDGSNPTTIATGLTSIAGCTFTINRTTAISTGTATVTYGAISGGSVDIYGWVLAGTASTGTENVAWVCVQ